MRARIAGLAMLAGASCGHPRALAMTASGTVGAGLIMLPFLTDCTEQPGSTCGTARIEAGIAGVVVGAAIALLVDKEWPEAEPPRPARAGPVWRAHGDAPPEPTPESPPPPPPARIADAPLPPFQPHDLAITFDPLVAPADDTSRAAGNSPSAACAAAKRDELERHESQCGSAGIAAIRDAAGPCECRVVSVDRTTVCSTGFDATCATDPTRAALGAGSAPSRTVAQARALENLLARCGQDRKPVTPATTCACTDDGCVCVATAECAKP